VDENREGISRRRLLKRMGAGVAVAWTAPVVTSLASPAFAQTPSCDPFCLTDPAFCGISAGCPDLGLPCEFGGCLPHCESRRCDCFDCGFIDSGGGSICTSDADCIARFGPEFKCGLLNPDPLCATLGAPDICYTCPADLCLDGPRTRGAKVVTAR
jgi:hypothetical protein